MGDDLLPANPVRYADDIRANTMGFLSVAQVGRCMGEMDNKVLDGAFLRGMPVLRKFLLVYILLIVNYISFTK